MRALGSVSLAAVCALSLAVAFGPGSASASPRRNVILIVTDDQPIGTLQQMGNVRALAQRGTLFRQAVVSNSLCCPSRATILTGLFSGHTGVWTNGDGGLRVGGWPAFRKHGINDDGTPFGGDGNNERRTLAYYLRHAGYRTGLFGKYLNHYEMSGGGMPPVPPGWSSWHSFVGANGTYYGYRSSDGGVPHWHGTAPSAYSTNVFGRKAVTFLRSHAIQSGSVPFFLYYAPFAPHGPITPAPGDGDVRAPVGFESRAYNEGDVSDKPAYVRAAPRISASTHASLDAAWDRMFGTLRSVDRWVGRFAEALPPLVRQRTIFIFMSDNGFEWGDHRLNYKVYPYERSIRIPLIFAGPGIRHATSPALASNADITPTVLDLVGLRGVGGPFDGRSLRPVLSGNRESVHREILLEHLQMPIAPSYCGVRTWRWTYVLYASGFQELYDLKRDPAELRNIAPNKPHIRKRLRVRTLAACDPLPPGW